MKHPTSRKILDRVLAAAKRFWKKPQRQASAFDEMQRGSAVGLTACALIAAGIGSPEGVILGAGLFGICAGALIGFLLWIGDETDEEPVVPPGRGRKERADIRRDPPGN